MAEDFRKLKIWQEGYKLVLLIYKLTNSFPREEKYGLSDQIRRSANSVIANIAESCGRCDKKDKIRQLYIARGEVEETKSHLEVSRGLNYVSHKEIGKCCQDMRF